VLTFGPTGITRHGDHIAAHRATMAAVERMAQPPNVFYYAVEGRWADELKIEGVEREPTHRIEMGDFFETKLAALACHSSQDDAREFFMQLSSGRQTEEHFHRALPPVERGRVSTGLFAA
jgi:LmbE family N-acetylglucosaminyl deacetylase